jgi:hypothetical protein
MKEEGPDASGSLLRQSPGESRSGLHGWLNNGVDLNNLGKIGEKYPSFLNRL